MWDELRNDPFLRTVAVIVIGILLFGLLFNTTTGGNSMMGGAEHAGQGKGYSFNSIISWLLLALIKILFVVLIGAVMIGAFIWVRNMFFRDNDSAIAKAINRDPLLKTVVLTTLAIIGLFILSGLVGSFSSPGFAGGMATGHMNGIYSPALGIAWLLTLLIRVLSYILVISLVIAIAIYLKDQYEKGNLNWFVNYTKTSGTKVEEKVVIVEEREPIT